MKKIGILAVLITVSAFGFAQPKQKNAAQRAAGESERMKNVMELNDTQYASVKSLNEKYSLQMQKLWRDSTLTADERKNQVKKIRTDKEAELKATVAPQQFEKWNTHKATTKQHRAKHHARRGKHGAHIKNELSLSEDQQVKFRQANISFGEKFKAVRQSKELTDAEKKSEFQKLKSEHDAAIKSILSAEQYQKWTTLKEAHKKDRRKHTK